MSVAAGERFGRLTILGEAAPYRIPCGKLKRMALARCDCGVERAYQISNLKTGNTTSCGCRRLEVTGAYNARRAEPQRWTVRGTVAHIILRDRRVLIDAADVPVVAQYRWYMNDTGYVASSRGGPMHRLILGLSRGDRREGDHRNNVPWDNRRDNLRVATSSQNKQNTRRPRTNTSGFKGVTWDKHRSKWTAQLVVAKKHIFLGRFAEIEDAVEAYRRGAAERYGEFARTE